MSITSPEVPDVYRAIRDVTKAMSKNGIAKDQKNAQQGYMFRGIDSVYNALSAELSLADLCILPRVTERLVDERATKDGKGVLFCVVVRVEFDFVSARDGSSHTVSMYGEAMDSGDKATNKAMSAAYKYACMEVFCIPTEGMPDADSTTPEPAHKVQRPVNGKWATNGKSEAATNAVNEPEPEIPVSDEAAAAASNARKQHAHMIEQFARVKTAIGPKAFVRILAAHGYEDVTEIRSIEIGRKVYADMAKELEQQVNAGAAK